MRDFDLKPAGDLGLSHRERTLSLRRESGLVESTLHVMWWSLMRGYLRLFHRLRVEGREGLPQEPPFVMVANHASHLDAIVLASVLPHRWRDRTFPLAAGDVFFETPSVATFAAMCLNAMPVWRHNCGRHALGELRQRLVEEGCVYILFPEGTRSEDGTVGEFKEGLGMLIAETGVPVVPCCLEGAYEAWPRDRRWPRAQRVRLSIGSPMSFPDCRNRRAGWSEIARRSREAVVALGSRGAAR